MQGTLCKRLPHLFIALVLITVTGVPHFSLAQTIPPHNLRDLMEQLALLQQRLFEATTGAVGTQNKTVLGGGAQGTSKVGVGIFAGGLRVDTHLDVGSRGEAVARLQRFLAQDATVYPEGDVTGYFGYATERAVSRFQSRCRILPPLGWNGDWFGCTGPLTRNALLYGCAFESAPPITPPPPAPQTPLPSHACGLNVTPVVGSAPLTVTINALLNSDRACSGATYFITTDDGLRSVESIGPGQCAQSPRTLSHTFTTPGQHQITCEVSGGAKRQVVVTVSQPPIPACSISVVSQSNGITTMTWQTYNATAASFDQGIGAVGLSGSRTETVSQRTRFTMTVTGVSGVTGSCFAEVVHVAPPVHAPWCSLYSAFSTIRQGGSTTLTWTSGYGDSVLLDGASVAASGSQTISPSVSTEYNLSVTNTSGTAQCTAPVTVQAYSQGGYYGQGSYGWGDGGGGDDGGGDPGGGDSGDSGDSGDGGGDM